MKAGVITTVDELHTKYTTYLTNHTRAICENVDLPPRVRVALVRFCKYEQRRAGGIAEMVYAVDDYVYCLTQNPTGEKMPRPITHQLTHDEFWLFNDHAGGMQLAINKLKYRGCEL